MRYWRKPLDFDRIQVPRGTVHVVVDRCKGCGFCVEYCPKEVLVMAEEFNRKGYHPPKVVKEGECVACNLCEMICPEFAIYSVTVAAEPPGEEHEGSTGEAEPGASGGGERRAAS